MTSASILAVPFFLLAAVALLTLALSVLAMITKPKKRSNGVDGGDGTCSDENSCTVCGGCNNEMVRKDFVRVMSMVNHTHAKTGEALMLQRAQ